MEDLFRQYFWLIFPLFFLVSGIFSSLSAERRTRATLDLIKTYVEQGKEPPPELLQLAAREDVDAWTGTRGGVSSGTKGNGGLWAFVVFAALAAGFGTAYWFERDTSYVVVAVATGVAAIGSLFILIFGRK